MKKPRFLTKSLAALATLSLMSITAQAFAACDASAVSYAVGHSLPSPSASNFEQLLNNYAIQAGATGGARYVPDGRSDRSYRTDRLWINVDTATQKIKSVSCGN